MMSIPAVAAEELKRRGDMFLNGDSGEGLRSGPPRCKIKEEPEAVIDHLATSPRLPGAIRKRKRKDSFLESLEGWQPCQHLDFELLAFRTVRE